MSSMTVLQAYAIALQHEKAGRLIPADRLCQQILAGQPDHVETLRLAGELARKLGRADVAYARFGRLCQLLPDDVPSHTFLGEACRILGRAEESRAAFQRAAERAPQDALAQQNLGAALHDLGRLPEAIDAYSRALALDASLVRCQIDLGVALAQSSRLDPAIAAFQRATELDPQSVEAWSNLGNALRLRGQLDLAAFACRRALALHPSHLHACLNLAIVLKDTGSLAEAAAMCQEAMRWRPDSAEAFNTLGVIYTAQGEPTRAIGMYRQALRFRRDYAEAQNNLGYAHKDAGELGDAIAAFQRALKLQPDHLGAWTNLLHTRLYDSRPGAEAQVPAEYAQWDRVFAEPRRAAGLVPHTNDRHPARPLRLGYVSGDFRDHVVGRNVLPLFLHHDVTEFEITCYSAVRRSDALTRQFQRCSRHWCDIAGLTDDAVAQKIREDGIDILVDLSQHTGGNRLALFAQEPAPVQVSFAGYPASSGVKAIRHRLSDRWLEGQGMHPVPVEGGEESTAAPPCVVLQSPSGAGEHVHLLDSFWCYDPGKLGLFVNDLPATARGHVTFGSLNNYCKVNDTILKLWGHILEAVPESVLLLICPPGAPRGHVAEVLMHAGAKVTQIELLSHLPRRSYLETYQRIDIALDPFPYGGHTTSLDALWMGVPIVTLAGQTAISRAGLSQLGNLGLTEFVAATPDDYVAVATQLATDLPRLAQLRPTLRRRMEASVLMDGARFTRQIEAAYRAMWREWCGREG